MRELVVHEADQLGVTIQIDEVSDFALLSQISPLSLPRLYIGGELIASQNPPQIQAVEQALLSRVQ